MGNYKDFNVDIKVVKSANNDKNTKYIPTCTCADRCHPGSYQCSDYCH